MTILILVAIAVFVVSYIVARPLFRRLGYDQWVYQRLYERDKGHMNESERAHMRQKFGVTD